MGLANSVQVQPQLIIIWLNELNFVGCLDPIGLNKNYLVQFKFANSGLAQARKELRPSLGPKRASSVAHLFVIISSGTYYWVVYYTCVCVYIYRMMIINDWWWWLSRPAQAARWWALISLVILRQKSIEVLGSILGILS